VVLLAGPLNAMYAWDLLGFNLLKDFVSSRDRQERMECLFYGVYGYPSVKCCLLSFLVIDFG